MTVSIDLCVGWVKVGEVIEGELNAVIRDLTTGEWQLAGEVAGVTLQGAYTLADVDTIRVTEAKKITFAGFVNPVTSGVGGLDITSSGTGKKFTLAGPDLWLIPGSRIAYPSPSTDPPWAAGYDERSGFAATVAAAYLYNNLGSLALAARQYPGLAIIEHGDGISGSWSARLQPLDQLVQRICNEGGITCRLSIDFAGIPTISLVPRRDRTASTVLSDKGDLVDIKQRRILASANYVIGGGQGLLTARTFRTAGTATGSDRLETFTDQTSLSTGTELQQAVDTKLAKSAATWNISSRLSTTAAQSLVYGVDYDIGDTIAVEIDNVRHSVAVTAVTFSVTPGLQVVTPVLGDAAPDPLAGLLGDVAGLQSRFQTTIA